ncbi:serine/arginine repetitive matrix protein 1-like isoform X1 [Corvus moneduloides]|uniref:serine/arginine repetitive matrix protein 1-like isoform X1 n=1 Tax=Corvus moneduloides TaxID=1196302 RepID=UPI001363F0C1|nr:serine/arginine repetitive matrix protein 1-like isoform X1 [Corvus moneduloides]XP_031951334.1 serine/arginine repetitive matrix protein 1-like isoform X1 [Corvus moneduloides]
MAELPLPAGLDASTFPAKLWRLANSPRVRSVRWDTQGRGLLIDRALFEQELLSPPGVQGPAPRTFRASQFRSIVRQLNRYGFYKVPGRAGAAVPGDAGAWLHYRNPWFRRDRPHLLLRIRRRSTANKHRLAPGPERRRRSPCGSQQRPRQRPRPAGPEGRGRFQPLPRERPPLPAGRPPSGFLLLHRERTLPDGRELRSRRPSRFQQPPRERPLLARRPPCGFHLLHRDRPQPARRDGPSRFQELYGERPLPAEREVPRIPPCELLGLYGEPLLPVRREGLSRLQELYGLQPPPAGLPPWAFQQRHTERPPPAGRELLRIPPCSFQQLQTEQQSPARKPSGTPGSSASSAPPGSAACAASTASSGSQNAPGQEELPSVDLGLQVEQMIREIRRSMAERSPFAQGNANVVPESSGGEAGNRAAAEGASPGTESCRNSSPEPEEPDSI